MPEIRLPVITLTTDFGSTDHYVGAVKAAILSVSTTVVIVDITHEIPRHDIIEAGWVLRNAFTTFPNRTVHVAVADPGVGTQRRPIVVSAQNHIFVGPDNGIFSFLYDTDQPARVHTITATHYMREKVSDTFHARDIFGPVAAHLARGADPANFGEPIEDFVRLEMPRPTVTPEGLVRAAVAHIDRFGNVILNVTRASAEALMARTGAAGMAATVNGVHVTHLCKTYGDGPEKTPFALFNSSDFFEIACNQGRAVDLLKVKRGDQVDLRLVQQASQ